MSVHGINARNGANRGHLGAFYSCVTKSRIYFLLYPVKNRTFPAPHNYPPLSVVPTPTVPGAGALDPDAMPGRADATALQITRKTAGVRVFLFISCTAAGASCCFAPIRTAQKAACQYWPAAFASSLCSLCLPCHAVPCHLASGLLCLSFCSFCRCFCVLFLFVRLYPFAFFSADLFQPFQVSACQDYPRQIRARCQGVNIIQFLFRI